MSNERPPIEHHENPFSQSIFSPETIPRLDFSPQERGSTLLMSRPFESTPQNTLYKRNQNPSQPKRGLAHHSLRFLALPTSGALFIQGGYFLEWALNGVNAGLASGTALVPAIVGTASVPYIWILLIGGISFLVIGAQLFRFSLGKTKRK